MRLAVAIIACLQLPASSVVTVRYFAIGSNLAASVREGRRGLRPLSSSPGLVKNARLAFNIPGFSPAEPAFASLTPSARAADECHGAIFELTISDWAKLCASEGVPAAYRVLQVNVQSYADDVDAVPAYTLTPGLVRSPVDLPPSERYLDLIRDGAREMGLKEAWQESLASIATAPASRRRSSGKTSRGAAL